MSTVGSAAQAGIVRRSLPARSNLHPLRPPKWINPRAIDLWLRAFIGDEGCDPVRRFEELCYISKLEPYSASKTGNADVTYYLRRRRQTVVRFLNTVKLLDAVKPRTRPTRSVEFYPGGFLLTISNRVNAPPNFKEFIHKSVRLPYRFSRLRDANGAYVAELDPATRFFVRNSMIAVPTRWVIGYTINCPMLPDLGNIAVPDEAYVIKQLWLPAANSRRPTNQPYLNPI